MSTRWARFARGWLAAVFRRSSPRHRTQSSAVRRALWRSFCRWRSRGCSASASPASGCRESAWRHPSSAARCSSTSCSPRSEAPGGRRRPRAPRDGLRRDCSDRPPAPGSRLDLRCAGDARGARPRGRGDIPAVALWRTIVLGAAVVRADGRRPRATAHPVPAGPPACAAGCSPCAERPAPHRSSLLGHPAIRAQVSRAASGARADVRLGSVEIGTGVRSRSVPSPLPMTAEPHERN